MLVLILGLILFLGIHSVRILADDWRGSMIARLGDGPWKGVYSLVSIAGFVLLVWGYGMARTESAVLYEPPIALKHAAIALNLIAFILIGIYLVPSGRLKARIGHPMILGVKTWAFAHLLANGRVADLVLFGAVLAWAVLDFIASRRRDRASGIVRIAGRARNDAIAVIVGVLIWAALLWHVHYWITGVSPLS
jgi:uncharacterized membrane protein